MLDADRTCCIARTDHGDLCLRPEMANRHGLIAGATGTGKTVTLQTLAETFSDLGVPVFMTDIKGDLSGISRPGSPQGKVAQRIQQLGLLDRGYVNRGFPVCFWDVFGRQGHPLRTTISEMGPLLLSRLCNCNDIQSGVLSLVFRIADDAGLLLLDMKDLRSMLQYVSDNRGDFTAAYGAVSPASVGAIQRGLLQLEEQHATQFFGEPAFDIFELLQTDSDGRGIVHILAADQLMLSPRVYAAALLWLLSELYEQLPETGDAAAPRLAMFFDEAHLLFNDAPPVLLEKIELVVRLIRSKGVSVWFVTQNPADIPDAVLSQLGNRVQHALRAFTPREQKAMRAAAQTFRTNPRLDAETVLGQLGVGEALVSFLDHKGVPAMVERACIVPPQGQIGPIDAAQRAALLHSSPAAGRYDQVVDRESAYEILSAQVARRQREKDAQETERRARAEAREQARASRADPFADIFGTLARQTTRTITTTVGREIGKQLLRGVLGGLFGKR